MDAALSLIPRLGMAAACNRLGIACATMYRNRPLLGPPVRPETPLIVVPAIPAPRLQPARALSHQERALVVSVLHEERFQDCSPAAVHATLLDEGRYLCSSRTMYRLLQQAGQTRQRRDQLIHPPYHKPELLASAPNRVWSWDITKLRGPAKWSYFYLYVVIDIYSRYVTGWMAAERESAELAKRLLQETIAKHDIPPGQLLLHADRGRVMRAKPLAYLLADLGVTRSHSRPYVSDDNPFSESQFRTLKYRPDFPDRFGCLLDCQAHCQRFFAWYNDQHRHSGIGMLTPASVHFGNAPLVLEQRQDVLSAAYRAHPERFVHGAPSPLSLPSEVWINKPRTASSTQGNSH